MARIKLDQKINTGSEFYGVTSAAELLDSGHAMVEMASMETRRSQGKTVTKYLLVLLDPKTNKPTDYAYEIGQKAYASRALKGQALVALLATPVPEAAPVEQVAAPVFNAESNLLTWNGLFFPSIYDAELESFTFDLHRSAPYIKRLIAAMRLVFPVVEWETGMYGEYVIINFCPTEAAPVKSDESLQVAPVEPEAVEQVEQVEQVAHPPYKVRFEDGLVKYTDLYVRGVWHGNALSFRFELDARDGRKGDLIAALMLAFPAIEWDSRVFGSRILLDFCIRESPVDAPDLPADAHAAYGVRYSVVRTDFEAAIRRQFHGSSEPETFVCNLETTRPDVAHAYAEFANGEARALNKRERYDVKPLDVLPVPPVTRRQAYPYLYTYVRTEYFSGDLIVIFNQYNAETGGFTDNCSMRLSRWNNE